MADQAPYRAFTVIDGGTGATKKADARVVPPLRNGGGGGTSGGMEAVDAKIAAAEARTDVKFATLSGKLDLIVASLERISSDATDAKSEARTTRRTIIGTGLSLGALILAIAAFGVNMFGAGSRVDDIARVEAQQVYNQAVAIEAAKATGRSGAASVNHTAAGNSSASR